MYTFNLRKDFKKKNASQVFEKLIIENENEFCIIYEKSFLYKGTPLATWNISYDYTFAAYAGQKLFDITENLTYHVPAPNTMQPYCFEFRANDMELLADALCYIGYTCDEDGETEARFMDDAVTWKMNVKDTITEVACFGLFRIADHPPQVSILF